MHLEQDRHQNEMYMLQNEIKKWQDKHDGTVKELHLRESAIHRIELELDSSRTDLERAKLQADKMESSKQLQESHCTQLNREIDAWKEKYNKAQDEVSDLFFREYAYDHYFTLYIYYSIRHLFIDFRRVFSSV